MALARRYAFINDSLFSPPIRVTEDYEVLFCVKNIFCDEQPLLANQHGCSSDTAEGHEFSPKSLEPLGSPVLSDGREQLQKPEEHSAEQCLPPSATISGDDGDVVQGHLAPGADVAANASASKSPSRKHEHGELTANCGLIAAPQISTRRVNAEQNTGRGERPAKSISAPSAVNNIKASPVSSDYNACKNNDDIDNNNNNININNNGNNISESGNHSYNNVEFAKEPGTPARDSAEVAPDTEGNNDGNEVVVRVPSGASNAGAVPPPPAGNENRAEDSEASLRQLMESLIPDLSGECPPMPDMALVEEMLDEMRLPQLLPALVEGRARSTEAAQQKTAANVTQRAQAPAPASVPARHARKDASRPQSVDHESISPTEDRRDDSLIVRIPLANLERKPYQSGPQKTSAKQPGRFSNPHERGRQAPRQVGPKSPSKFNRRRSLNDENCDGNAAAVPPPAALAAERGRGAGVAAEAAAGGGAGRAGGAAAAAAGRGAGGAAAAALSFPTAAPKTFNNATNPATNRGAEKRTTVAEKNSHAFTPKPFQGPSKASGRFSWGTPLSDGAERAARERKLTNFEVFFNVARNFKHCGDAESLYLVKVKHYINSVVSYLLGGELIDSGRPETEQAVSMYQRTLALARFAFDLGPWKAPPGFSQDCRLAVLCLKLLAFINHRIYQSLSRDSDSKQTRTGAPPGQLASKNNSGAAASSKNVPVGAPPSLEAKPTNNPEAFVSAANKLWTKAENLSVDSGNKEFFDATESGSTKTWVSMSTTAFALFVREALFRIERFDGVA